MVFASFKKLANSTYLYDHPVQDKKTHTSPDAILLCTWLSATPRDIMKFINHYKHLYPASRIILCTSSFSSMLVSPATSVVRAQTAVDLLPSTISPSRLLVHAFSGGGGLGLQAVCRAYRRSHGGAPFNPAVVILDSTPGPDSAWGNYTRCLNLARGGLPKTWFWRLFARFYAGAFLFAFFYLARLRGYPSLAVLLRKTLNDPRFMSTNARRCYIYSDNDAIIDVQDVESHAEEARRIGYRVDMQPYKGSQHVAHMRSDPARYWSTISSLWKSTVTSSKL